MLSYLSRRPGHGEPAFSRSCIAFPQASALCDLVQRKAADIVCQALNAMETSVAQGIVCGSNGPEGLHMAQATRIQLALADGTLADFTPQSQPHLWRAVQVTTFAGRRATIPFACHAEAVFSRLPRPTDVTSSLTSPLCAQRRQHGALFSRCLQRRRPAVTQNENGAA